jgi:hypothetical protein
MHGRYRPIVAIRPNADVIHRDKPANRVVSAAAEMVERRAGTKGKCEPTKHAPGAGPGRRVPGVGTHTASREAQQEGTVHRVENALAPIMQRCGMYSAQNAMLG